MARKPNLSTSNLIAEAQRLGWYCTFAPFRGFTPCEKDAQGAMEDLNRTALYLQNGVDPLAR